jgi:hypothetical protein
MKLLGRTSIAVFAGALLFSGASLFGQTTIRRALGVDGKVDGENAVKCCAGLPTQQPANTGVPHSLCTRASKDAINRSGRAKSLPLAICAASTAAPSIGLVVMRPAHPPAQGFQRPTSARRRWRRAKK